MIVRERRKQNKGRIRERGIWIVLVLQEVNDLLQHGILVMSFPPLAAPNN
jgi:hypothetical protein